MMRRVQGKYIQKDIITGKIITLDLDQWFTLPQSSISEFSSELRNGAQQIWRGWSVLVGILPFALKF